MEITKKIQYPYLPEGKTLFYVDIGNPFMARAKEVASGSNERQQPTGVVIVCEDKIVAEASNKNPFTSAWLIQLHQKYCIRHLLGVASGKKYWACPGCAGKESHAESRAAKKLVASGVKGECDLYLWGHWWCCDTCWNNMLKVPIRNVYLLEGGDILFNPKIPGNIIGKQFQNS